MSSTVSPGVGSHRALAPRTPSARSLRDRSPAPLRRPAPYPSAARPRGCRRAGRAARQVQQPGRQRQLHPSDEILAAPERRGRPEYDGGVHVGEGPSLPCRSRPHGPGRHSGRRRSAASGRGPRLGDGEDEWPIVPASRGAHGHQVGHGAQSSRRTSSSWLSVVVPIAMLACPIPRSRARDAGRAEPTPVEHAAVHLESGLPGEQELILGRLPRAAQIEHALDQTVVVQVAAAVRVPARS